MLRHTRELSLSSRLGLDAYQSPGGPFDQLQFQLESLVAANGGSPAVIISLSMGSTYFSTFLQRHVSGQWSERHVAAFVSLSGEFTCKCQSAGFGFAVFGS